jgi:hypothetical protein
MRKYTAAPKSIADALRNAVPVSDEAALGDDWKKLPYRTSSRAKVGKRVSAKLAAQIASHIAVSRKKVYLNPVRKGKSGFVHHVQIGELHLEIPGTVSKAYTEDLVSIVKDYVQKHPVKKQTVRA